MHDDKSRKGNIFKFVTSFGCTTLLAWNSYKFQYCHAAEHIYSCNNEKIMHIDNNRAIAAV